MFFIGLFKLFAFYSVCLVWPNLFLEMHRYWNRLCVITIHIT